MTDLPGTYREADSSKVAWAEAKAAWAEAAHPILVLVAGEFGSWITYKDLAERIQAETGIHTRVLLPNWIGEVLGQVARTCAQNGEPSLTSLVVHTDQTIGDGYVWALRELGRDVPDDLEQAAAVDRLECYRYFGADVPDGAEPMLTPSVRAKRSRSAQQRRPSTAACPTCYRSLPLTGKCDKCE